MNKNQKIFGGIIGLGIVAAIFYLRSKNNVTPTATSLPDQNPPAGNISFTGFENADGGAQPPVQSPCERLNRVLYDIHLALKNPSVLKPSDISRLRAEEMKILSALQNSNCK